MWFHALETALKTIQLQIKRLHGANLTVFKCLRYADLVPKHSLLRKGIWVRLLYHHFVLSTFQRVSADCYNMLLDLWILKYMWAEKGNFSQKFKWWLYKPAPLHARFTIFNFCAQVKFRSTKITVFKSMGFRCLHDRWNCHFENTPLLLVFSNWPGFGNGLDQRCVNGRCNHIESDAVTSETAFV